MNRVSSHKLFDEKSKLSYLQTVDQNVQVQKSQTYLNFVNAAFTLADSRKGAIAS